MQLSMLEIYNETVRDLLGAKDKGGDLPKLDIRIVAEGVSQPEAPYVQSQTRETLEQHEENVCHSRILD